MWKPRRKTWFAVALLLIITASLPPVRWRVIGWARGESFFQDRPTSYWAKELAQCDMMDDFVAGDLYFFPREPTALEQWLHEKIAVKLASDWNSQQALQDPDALPVLTELLADQDLQVQLAAAQALGYMGPAGKPAWSKLQEIQAATQEYLVWREAGRAMAHIDGAATTKKPDRPDRERLWQRYRNRLHPGQWP
jgi:hypothetical protein